MVDLVRPTQGPHPPMPTRPCPHRAGPDPEVLLLHVLDVLIDPAVPQHLEVGELTEAARALSSPTAAEGVWAQTADARAGKGAALTESTVSCCEKPTGAMP